MAQGKRRAAAGEVPADAVFDPFFDRVYPELIKRGVRRCRNLHDAQDAAAEIMIEIRRRWFSIDNHEAYAHRALVNRIARIRSSIHAERTDLRPSDELPDRPDPDPAFDDYAARQWAAQLLGRLSPAQRLVMQLLIDGSTYGEIAAQLGCTEDAVRQNVRHARRKLRAGLPELDRKEAG